MIVRIAMVVLAGLATAFSSYLLANLLDNRRLVRRANVLIEYSGYPLPRSYQLAQPLSWRVCRSLLAVTGALAYRIMPAGTRSDLEARLTMAGWYDPAVREFVAVLQAFSWISGLVIGCWLGTYRLALGVVFGAVIILANSLALRLFLACCVQRRRQTITMELPDVLDLVTASVEAGLGFDAAVLRVALRPLRSASPLQAELSRYLSDVRLGRSRVDALHDLARRTAVPDLVGVTTALVQADQLGVGVSAVLRAQAQHIRTKRRQRAQAAALQAPIKLLIPLVFFIFPAMFVITLGPATLRLLDTFTKVDPK